MNAAWLVLSNLSVNGISDRLPWRQTLSTASSSNQNRRTISSGCLLLIAFSQAAEANRAMIYCCETPHWCHRFPDCHLRWFSFSRLMRNWCERFSVSCRFSHANAPSLCVSLDASVCCVAAMCDWSSRGSVTTWWTVCARSIALIWLAYPLYLSSSHPRLFHTDKGTPATFSWNI